MSPSYYIMRKTTMTNRSLASLILDGKITKKELSEAITEDLPDHPPWEDTPEVDEEALKAAEVAEQDTIIEAFKKEEKHLEEQAEVPVKPAPKTRAKKSSAKTQPVAKKPATTAKGEPSKPVRKPKAKTKPAASKTRKTPATKKK